MGRGMTIETAMSVRMTNAMIMAIVFAMMSDGNIGRLLSFTGYPNGLFSYRGRMCRQWAFSFRT